MCNLKLRKVSELEGLSFIIPYYQRGYRWKQQQVEQLIDDIDSFQPTKAHPFYFLQVIAVSENMDSNHCIHVIDGQQRLTTISLILESLSEDFSFKIKYDREADKDIDKYFKQMAKEVIDRLLPKDNIAKRELFLKKLLNCAFLYHNVKPECELELFSDLNSGKIPAKNSELVKCVLNTPLQDEDLTVTQERANEWDMIERELNNDDFFAMFAPKNLSYRDDRMTVLFRWAQLTPTEEEFKNQAFPFLSHIQKAIEQFSRHDIWMQICMAFYNLKRWYEAPSIYHLIGWYINGWHTKKYNCSLVNSVTEATKIQNSINSANYADNPNFTKDLLLLFNSAYCWQRGLRFNFNTFQNVSWTLEHIFARNQEDLSKEDLKLLLTKDDSTFEDLFLEYQEACKKSEGNAWLAEKLGDSYPKENIDNSLGNLALLGHGTNSSLNNNLYQKKRKELLDHYEYQRGKYEYVPPATLAVFLKTLPGLDSAVPYWSEPDREQYVSYIAQAIGSFINEFNKNA